MKVLSIGNSFSQDAHNWLHKLAAVNGIDMYTVNLFIPGCPLSLHWQNILENKADYWLEVNGAEGVRQVSIKDAFDMEKWDIITVQQVSIYSGMPQTYIPYITNLVDYIKKYQPQADIYFHQTWSYEIDFNLHDGFLPYNNDQHEMYRRLSDACQMVENLVRLKVIPAGKVIQTIRETVPEFDYKNGGLSLCRDGYHLSFDYGRFAAAATWIKTLIGKNLAVTPFQNFDLSLIEKILSVVND